MKETIGVDAYNLQLTGGVAMTLRAKAADSEHIPCVIVPLTEKRFFEWYEDDTSVTLRNKSGSYGGVRSVDCEQVCGALCFDDYKGLNRQAVEQGKWVVLCVEK